MTEYIDFGVRGPDQKTVEEFLLARGLGTRGLAHTRWVDGVSVHGGIPIEIKPAVADDKTGDVLFPAEYDPAYHANIRLRDPVRGEPNLWTKEEIAAKIDDGGTVQSTLVIAKASDRAAGETKPIWNRTISGVTIVRLNMRKDAQGKPSPDLAQAGEVKTPAWVWF